MYDGFSAERLDDDHVLYCGWLPDALAPSKALFETMWALHPEDFHQIKMYGRLVKTPRWQQAYGRDYKYTHNTNKALPVPTIIQPYLEWAQRNIDRRLNGLLLNWYDAQHGHYIGKHRDSTTNLVKGTPIVTISLGEERVFRLRQWKGTASVEFPATDGRVFIMPWETNRDWTHEVPHSSASAGRRISITLRGFVDD